MHKRKILTNILEMIRDNPKLLPPSSQLEYALEDDEGDEGKEAIKPEDAPD